MLLNDLKKSSTVSVHFLQSQVDFDFNSLGIKVMEGSVGEIRTNEDLFVVVASAMNFPDYFGKNWDALGECLEDLEWLSAEGYLLILRDSHKGWSMNPYLLGCFVTAWLEASEYWAEQQKSFHLVFAM